MHYVLFVLIVIYDSEMVVWREKEKSRVRTVWMDKLVGLLGIGRINRIPKVHVK